MVEVALLEAFEGLVHGVGPHVYMLNHMAKHSQAGLDASFAALSDVTRRGVLHDLYSSKEALDAAMASGEKSGMAETFDQLDQLLAGSTL
jgi:hypothetical protein